MISICVIWIFFIMCNKEKYIDDNMLNFIMLEMRVKKWIYFLIYFKKLKE